MIWIREHADQAAPPRTVRSPLFHSAYITLKSDRDFRLLAIAAASFGASMMLFPHYQALARIKLDMGLTNLMTWVVVQNIGMALFGFPAGALADRYGNRLVLRYSLFSGLWRSNPGVDIEPPWTVRQTKLLLGLSVDWANASDNSYVQ